MNEMQKVAIIGAGGTGHALAADATLAGYDVSLFEEPEYKSKLENAQKLGGIEIVGAVRQGFARIGNVTTNLEKALQDAPIILISVVANRHERIAELCAQYVKAGQTILVGPDNGGALVFAGVLKERGITGVEIVGMGMNYYPCRMVGEAKVLIALPRVKKRVAAFPAKDTAKVISKLNILKDIFEFVPATNVLETALSSPNTVIHGAASLLNAGAIEQSGGQYHLYRQGITPAILKCVEATTKERIALFNALGYPVFPDTLLEKVYKQKEFPELEMFRGLIGPTSMQHRYLTEDTSTAVALMVSLGEALNIPMPVTKALVTVISAVLQTDFLKEGRTVQKLGLPTASIGRLNNYLFEGK